MDKPSYLAIDISAEHLQEAGTRLQERHPSIPMLGICADYSQPLELPLPKAWQSKPMVGFFPGSSLGNFEPDAAINFLQRIRQLLGENAQLLIGIDQPREPSQLEAAYDDKAGVSAAFAKNLLRRLQRDLAIELDPEPFTYQAAWEQNTSASPWHWWPAARKPGPSALHAFRSPLVKRSSPNTATSTRRLIFWILLLKRDGKDPSAGVTLTTLQPAPAHSGR